MSYSTIFQIEPAGDVVAYKEFPNAFAGAMLIWMDLIKRYGLGGDDGAVQLLLDPMFARRVWDLVTDPRVSEHDNLVLTVTFDRLLFRSIGFPLLIRSLRKFHENLPVESKHCHTAAWADAIEEMPSDTIGCGWQQTSVNINPWWIYDAANPDSEGRPYNVFTDQTTEHSHSWIFEASDGG